MDKRLLFVLVVQTHAIVCDIQNRRKIASQLVEQAARLDIGGIELSRVGEAAIEYAEWGYGGVKPAWVVS